jgi:hypothetical protein
VYGTSGLFRLAAEEQHCRVATYDADIGVAQVCVSGVAAQGEDLPRAFDALWHSEPQERRSAIAIAQDELQRRIEARDRYGFQVLPAEASGNAVDSTTILIPMNVEWDTAALGKHVHFANSTDWITSTVTAILEADAGPVIVRQHPSERRDLQRSRLDIGSALRDLFGDDPRCRFVAADAAVNTYDLLHAARFVLPFVSTIAIEAAAMGKPVLISGTCFYADLGFVWSATSRDEYLDLVQKGAQGRLPTLPEQVERAWICYYLAAIRNRIWTDFTAQPDNFWNWCGRSPDAIFDDPEVSAMLEAIDRDVPVSILRHRQLSSLNHT